MLWWVARKGEQLNKNNTASCEFGSQNQAAIIIKIYVICRIKFMHSIVLIQKKIQQLKNDDGLVEVISSNNQPSYASKRPDIVLLALPRGTRSLRDRAPCICDA